MEEEEREAVIRIIYIKEKEEDEEREEQEESEEKEKMDADDNDVVGLRPDSGFSESPMKRPGSVVVNPAKRIKIETCEPKQGKETYIRTSINILKCTFCNLVPSKRSQLYGHYSFVHYRKEIMEKHGNQSNNCTRCETKFKIQKGLVQHYGTFHNMVEEFLPSIHHVPLSHKAMATAIKASRPAREPHRRLLDPGSRDLLTPSPTPEHLDQHIIQHKPDKDILFCDRCDFTTIFKTHFDSHINNAHREICKPNKTNKEVVIKQEPEDFVASLVYKLANELDSDEEENEEKEEDEEKVQGKQEIDNDLEQSLDRKGVRDGAMKKEPESNVEDFSDTLKDFAGNKLFGDDYEFSDNEGEKIQKDKCQAYVKEEKDEIGDDLASRIDELIAKPNKPALKSYKLNEKLNDGIPPMILNLPKNLTTEYKSEIQDSGIKIRIKRHETTTNHKECAKDKYVQCNPMNLQTFDPSFTKMLDIKKLDYPDIKALKDLDVYVVCKGQLRICSLCRVFKNKSTWNVRNHIESKHFPGIFSYTCTICTKVLGSKTAFRDHPQSCRKQL